MTRGQLARRVLISLVVFSLSLCMMGTRALAEDDYQDEIIKDVRLNYLVGFDRYDTQFGRLNGTDRLRDNNQYQDLKTYATGLVVATGANHADPISASALAGELGYSFIYVNPKGNSYLSGGASLNNASGWVAAMNNQGCVSDIVIVGGTSAVPPKVEAELRAAFPHASVERVWGTNRYDTSRKILAYGRAHGDGWGNTAVVASGARWPDGTSSAGLAAHLKAPIFLADSKGRVSQADLAELATFTNVVIVGGPLVVSSETEAAIARHSQVKRLWGQDRYGTNLQVALYELTLQRADGQPAFSTEAGFYLAKGSSFADYIPLAANLATGADEYRGIVVMADPGHGEDAIVREFGAEARKARGQEETPLEFFIIVGDVKRGYTESPTSRLNQLMSSVVWPIMGDRQFDVVWGNS